MVTLNISKAALAALYDLLDINDDDEVLAEAGVDPAALASLRVIVQRASSRPASFENPQGIGG